MKRFFWWDLIKNISLQVEVNNEFESGRKKKAGRYMPTDFVAAVLRVFG